MDFEYEIKEKKNMVYFYVDGMKINEIPKDVLMNVMGAGCDMEGYVESAIYSQSYGNCCLKKISNYVGKISRKR